jgi:hypothetical protein
MCIGYFRGISTGPVLSYQVKLINLRRLTEVLFTTALLNEFETRDYIKLVTLYRRFIEKHGSRVFWNTWRATNERLPYWDYVKDLFDEINKAVAQGNTIRYEQLQLLMEFLICVLQTSFQSSDSLDHKLLLRFCCTDERHLDLKKPLQIFKQYRSANFDLTCEWIAVVVFDLMKISLAANVGLMESSGLAKKLYSSFAGLENECHLKIASVWNANSEVTKVCCSKLCGYFISVYL